MNYINEINNVLNSYLFEDDNDINVSKNIFIKIRNIYLTFLNDLKKIIVDIINSKKLKRAINVINRVLKTNPGLREERINFRLYEMPKDERGKKRCRITMANNLATTLKYSKDEKFSKIYNEYINTYYGVAHGKMKISDAINYINEGLKLLMTEIEIEKSEFNLKSIYKKSLSYEYQNPHRIKKFFTNLIVKFSRRMHILSLNIDNMIYSIQHHGYKKIKGIAQEVTPNRDERFKEIIKSKSTKEIGQMKFGNKTFNIFQYDGTDVSCFNDGGLDIYVNKNFFNYSKGIQQAVILHEIGHEMCGQFNVKKSLLDERKIIKRIRKLYHKYEVGRWNRFLMPDIAGYTRLTSDSLENGDELIYLLTEIEADNFATKYVGKFLLKSGINRVLEDTFQGERSEKDIAFNKMRVNLRASLWD